MNTVFFHSVTGQPTRVFAVPLSDTSIQVSWDPPGDPTTGYVIYYQPEGGAVSSVMVTGGDTESHQLDALQSGVNYSVSIVALSDHLPSAVVGPVTLSGKSCVGERIMKECTYMLYTYVYMLFMYIYLNIIYIYYTLDIPRALFSYTQGVE